MGGTANWLHELDIEGREYESSLLRAIYNKAVGLCSTYYPNKPKYMNDSWGHFEGTIEGTTLEISCDTQIHRTTGVSIKLNGTNIKLREFITTSQIEEFHGLLAKFEMAKEKEWDLRAKTNKARMENMRLTLKPFGFVETDGIISHPRIDKEAQVLYSCCETPEDVIAAIFNAGKELGRLELKKELNSLIGVR